MWVTILEWILALGSAALWIYNFTFFWHRQIYEWIDNKIGKDDPMPPMPNQTNPMSLGKVTESNNLTKQN